MAMKSSKIAVTLQPSLKQKLREYGKENQIKNFSGVILAILDEYFGSSDSGASSPSSPSSDVWAVINDLAERVNKLEGGTATTAKPKEKPKKVIKPKTVTKVAAAKPKVAKSATKSVSKVSKPAKPAKKASSTRTTTKKSVATKSKSTRGSKASSKAAPAKKAKAAPTRRTTTTRKSSKAKASSSNQWMSTREAFDLYGGNLSWSRFSKLTPEELKDRFNLDSDLSRKVRGSRFNQWLTLGK